MGAGLNGFACRGSFGGAPLILGGTPPSLLGFGIRFGGAPPFWGVPLHFINL